MGGWFSADEQPSASSFPPRPSPPPTRPSNEYGYHQDWTAAAVPPQRPSTAPYPYQTPPLSVGAASTEPRTESRVLNRPSSSGPSTAAPPPVPAVSRAHAPSNPPSTPSPATVYECPFCKKKFPVSKYADVTATKQAGAQHIKAAHGSKRQEEGDFAGDAPDPPVDTPGKWISREAFRVTGKNKSFGYFKCTCGKFWVSAHSFWEYMQGCQSCERKTFPKLLWDNYTYSRKAENDERLNSPHDQQRCDACKAGKCLERDTPRVRSTYSTGD